jgi:D-xylonolactonase
MDTPVVVADRACVLGEAPLWHEAEQALYWSDVVRGRLFRHDPARNSDALVYEGVGVGGFTVQADGGLLLFLESGAIATWRGGALRQVVAPSRARRGLRFNDVSADPRGRVLCGLMPVDNRVLHRVARRLQGAFRRMRLPVARRRVSPGPARGCVCRLERDGRLTPIVDGLRLPNGMGFTPDGRELYLTDSGARTIYRGAYDAATGTLGTLRVFVRVGEGEGVPDGLAVDAGGDVWSARWDGGCLVRYRADGREVERVTFDARKVSSAAFGGAALDALYVTTAGGERRAEEGPGAGALFRLRPGVGGRREFTSAVGL